VPAVLSLLSLPLALTVMLVHARATRVRAMAERPAVLAVVARMPSADFAFAGGSRHLRFVTLEEPGAAFADGPGMPDPDPAGGLVGAPREAWAEVPVNVAGKKTTP
jgi:hypothetical protein